MKLPWRAGWRCSACPIADGTASAASRDLHLAPAPESGRQFRCRIPFSLSTHYSVSLPFCAKLPRFFFRGLQRQPRLRIGCKRIKLEAGRVTFSIKLQRVPPSAIALLLATGVALKGAFCCRLVRLVTCAFTFSPGCEGKSRARIRPHVNNFGASSRELGQ